MSSWVSGSQCLWHHSSVKNTCVEEAACVDLYDGNELSQVVPSVAPQQHEEQARFTPTLHIAKTKILQGSLPS